ncbi:MAG: hypothetical protein ACYSR9_15205 [Planctomycetota bacterium]|jgi:hypothetical protein
MAGHRCFVCDEDNPERIVTYTSEDCIFEFNDRFEGPKGRAHGGIAIGALTCPALQLAERDGMRHPVALSVTGRMNLPVPLAKPVIVAAIDCATLYTLIAWDQDFVRQLLREKKLWMTDTYGVRFLIVPPVKNKKDYIVTARFLGIERRKLFAISALLDSKGKVYAIGEATGIIFDLHSD